MFKTWNEFRRNSPVLIRMGTSYGILVVAVAVALSSFSFFFFQHKYDQELESLHRVLLENMEREIKAEVLDVAKNVYMSLSMDVIAPFGSYFSADDQPAGNEEKLFWTHRELSNLVSRHATVVAAIHLYYRGSGIFLSTTQGVKYEASSPENLRGSRWLERLVRENRPSLWLERDETESSPSTVTSLQVYPILALPEDAEVLVSIEFRLEVLKAVLDRFTSQNTGLTLLVTPSGQVVTGGTGTENLDKAGLEQIVNRPMPPQITGSFQNIQGIPSLVTVLPIPSSDWFLINVTPLDHLHRKDGEIFLVLLLISLGVILFGLVISIPLIFRIYHPLDRLIGRIKGLLGRSLRRPEEIGDEYRIIDYAIEELTTTLHASKPVIKHELVSRLLEGAPVAQADFDDTLRLLDLQQFPETCLAANLRLLEGGWVAKFRLLEELERQGGPLLLATPLTGLDLGLVVDAAPGDELETIARGWVALARDVCGTAVCVSFGRISRSPFELGQSYDDARRLAEFRFFHPETSVFLGREDLLNEAVGLSLPEAVLQALSEALHIRSQPKVDAALAEVIRFVRTPGLSVERGRSELYRATRSISKIVSESRVITAPDILKRLDGLPSEAKDLVEWQASVSALAADLFAQIENRTDDRNSVLVGRVRGYVSEHLAEELSLDRVAAAVSISPSYLSKVFKDVSGVNFVSYVTEVRIQESQRLLQQSGATIQEIGKLVGFNTPAYFIHQFRVRFGLTPYEYRRSLPPKP